MADSASSVEAPLATLCESCGTGTKCRGLPVCVRCIPARYEFSYRQLSYWTDRGYVRPAEPHPGTGYSLDWPPAELEIARRMARLISAGIAVSVAAKFARESWPFGDIAPGCALWIWEGP